MKECACFHINNGIILTSGNQIFYLMEKSEEDHAEELFLVVWLVAHWFYGPLRKMVLLVNIS